MKIITKKILINSGPFSSSRELKVIESHIEAAIKSVQWPPHSGSFTIHEQSGKKRNEGNGVTPIKNDCMEYLKAKGWSLETRVSIDAANKPGPMDATLSVGNKLFCFEWETGNISSSHRALNKIAVGMLNGILIGGVLILPTRTMYSYLTDRVGNFKEIEPYFPLWKSLPIKEGYLAVIAIEHDAVSTKVPRIPKGTDGRALY